MKSQKSFNFAPAKTHPNYWQHSKLWPILIFWETVTFGFALDFIIVGQIIQYQITSKEKNWTTKCRICILGWSNIPGWHFATFLLNLWWYVVRGWVREWEANEESRKPNSGQTDRHIKSQLAPCVQQCAVHINCMERIDAFGLPRCRRTHLV